MCANAYAYKKDVFEVSKRIPKMFYHGNVALSLLLPLDLFLILSILNTIIIVVLVIISSSTSSHQLFCVCWFHSGADFLGIWDNGTASERLNPSIIIIRRVCLNDDEWWLNCFPPPLPPLKCHTHRPPSLSFAEEETRPRHPKTSFANLPDIFWAGGRISKETYTNHTNHHYIINKLSPIPLKIYIDLTMSSPVFSKADLHFFWPTWSTSTSWGHGSFSIFEGTLPGSSSGNC